MTPDVIYLERDRRGPWYDEYRRLRHAIFVNEQGWQGLSSPGERGLTVPETVDADAWFWLARDHRGSLIGAVRILPVQPVFPHRELFARHNAEPVFAAMRPRLGSLNSLAVEAAWRRRRCCDERGRAGTVAALLLQRCVADCPGAGIDALVATAQTVISLRALMRAGFHVIDPPAQTHLHPGFSMCNVGAVLKLSDRAAVLLASYFRRCEQDVLGSLMEGAGVVAIA